MKFQLGLTSWNFNSGWDSPYNQLLNIFSADMYFDALITRVLLAYLIKDQTLGESTV